MDEKIRIPDNNWERWISKKTFLKIRSENDLGRFEITEFISSENKEISFRELTSDDNCENICLVGYVWNGHGYDRLSFNEDRWITDSELNSVMHSLACLILWKNGKEPIPSGI